MEDLNQSGAFGAYSTTRGGGIPVGMPYNWRYNFFTLLGTFAKFIRYLRLRMIFFHPADYLAPLHFQIINDVAYSYKETSKHRNKFTSFINRDRVAIMKLNKNRIKGVRKSLRKFYRGEWSGRVGRSSFTSYYHSITYSTTRRHDSLHPIDTDKVAAGVDASDELASQIDNCLTVLLQSVGRVTDVRDVDRSDSRLAKLLFQ